MRIPVPKLEGRRVKFFVCRSDLYAEWIHCDRYASCSNDGGSFRQCGQLWHDLISPSETTQTSVDWGSVKSYLRPNRLSMMVRIVEPAKRPRPTHSGLIKFRHRIPTPSLNRRLRFIKPSSSAA
jgi:hypothetical protein